MTLGLLLILFALGVGWTASPVLRLLRHSVPPLATVACWVLAAVVVLAGVPAGAALALAPEVTGSSDWAQAVHRCWQALREAGLVAPEVLLHGVASVLALLLALRLGTIGLRHRRRLRRAEDRHRDALALLSSPLAGAGEVVTVPHGSPLAFSLAGRAGPTVLTTGLVQALPQRQLHAVLAHEEAHRRRGHHRYLAVFTALRKAFPFVPLFRTAVTEIALLVELDADAVAARRFGAGVVLDALGRFRHGGLDATPNPAPGNELAVRAARLTGECGRPRRWLPVLPVAALAAGYAVVMWLAELGLEPCVVSLMVGPH